MQKEKRHGRILALDVGKKRIGLAVSDELGVTAQGLETFKRTRIRDDLSKLKQLTGSLNVGLLLVGKPLHMSGSESRQSEYTREFAERFSEYAGLRYCVLGRAAHLARSGANVEAGWLDSRTAQESCRPAGCGPAIGKLSCLRQPWAGRRRRRRVWLKGEVA